MLTWRLMCNGLEPVVDLYKEGMGGGGGGWSGQQQRQGNGMTYAM